MDMKLNSTFIRLEREKRAWSQEHLAGATGLGLRTIQRIESTGSASYESATAIAAVFDLPVTALRVDDLQPAAQVTGKRRWFTWHRLFTLLGIGVVVSIFTPPDFRQQIPAVVTLWLACELAILTRRGGRLIDRP
jgi:transcriptional regulator with XRE-family HTH domain